jgi:hypothetical protein
MLSAFETGVRYQMSRVRVVRSGVGFARWQTRAFAVAGIVCRDIVIFSEAST